MQIELSQEQMTGLGRAIAIANVTAVADYIADNTANWPGEELAALPPETEGDAARLAYFRGNRERVKFNIEQEKQNSALLEERAKSERVHREAAEKERIARETPAYEAELAKWKIDRDYATAAGRNAPPEPQKPMTDDEIALERSRTQTMGGF